MNPLPFFPPPARAFSQQGKHAPGSSTSSSNDSAGGSKRPTSGRERTKSGSSHWSNLRATLSSHGGPRGMTASTPANGGAPTEREGFFGGAIPRMTPSNNAGGSGAKTTTAASANTSTNTSTTQLSQPMSRAASDRIVPTSETLRQASSNLATAVGISSNSSTKSSSSSGNSSGDTTAERQASPLPPPTPASPGGSRPSTAPSASASSSRKPSRALTLPVPSGRTGLNLPKGLHLDYVRYEEVSQAHSLETQAYDAEDQASRDRIKYRQQKAPHLFLGAFVPATGPKVAGPLSVSGGASRKLIGYINGTASSSLSARSLAVHTVSNEEEGEEAWLVCVHSIVVDEPYRHKGVGLRLLEEFMTRLRRHENHKGDPAKGELESAKGYECVALLTHEETIKFFLKAGFRVQGLSHVRVGSGSWVEMRRSIKGGKEEEKKSADSAVSKDEEKKSADGPLSTLVADTHAASTALGTPSEKDPASDKAVAQSLTSQTVTAKTSPPPQKTTAPTSKSTTPPLSSATPATASSKPSGAAPSGLGGFSQADLLAALSASSKGYAPGQNPSLAFSSVLGQTLAGKTFVEDAFVALEARLVDKKKSDDRPSAYTSAAEGSNLAEIWCPREECGCKLVRKGVCLWELAESGPMTDLELSSSSLPKGAAVLPPVPQAPPAPSKHINALKERERESAKLHQQGQKGGRNKKNQTNDEDGQEESFHIRSTLPGAPPRGEVSTPIRPFWSCLNAMSFDNIGFSKDVQWKVPLLPSASPSMHMPSTSGGDDFDNLSRARSISNPRGESGSPSSHMQQGSASSSSSAASNATNTTGSGSTVTGGTGSSEKRHRSIRRPTFLGGLKKEKPDANKDRFPHIQHLHMQKDVISPNCGGGGGQLQSPMTMSPTSDGSSSDAAFGNRLADADDRPQQTLTVKYLLCPQCDTGPLGYTIVPAHLTGGKMGVEVGSDLSRQQTGGAEERKPMDPADIQVFLLAAERVRYRFIK